MPGTSTLAPNVNQPPLAPVHHPAAPPPPPNPAPGPSRNRWGPQPPPPLSDRTLRSKGLASHGLLPKPTQTRTRTTMATAPPSTTTTRPTASPPTPTAENPQPLAPTAQSSSWTPWGLGFIGKLLPWGGAEADEPDIANIDQVNNQASCSDSSELEGISSFF